MDIEEAMLSLLSLRWRDRLVVRLAFVKRSKEIGRVESTECPSVSMIKIIINNKTCTTSKTTEQKKLADCDCPLTKGSEAIFKAPTHPVQAGHGSSCMTLPEVKALHGNSVISHHTC